MNFRQGRVPIPFMIQSISSLGEFNGIRQEWDALYEKADVDNLFLTHKWLSNWLKHFGGSDWAALLERSVASGNLSSAAVFRVGDGRAAFIETDHSYFPDVLCLAGTTARLKGFLPHLLREFRPKVLHLVQCPSERRYLRQIESSAGKDWYILEREGYMMRAIEVKGGLGSYLSTRTKKLRHELRRKIRRLEKEGEATLECFESGEQLDNLFDRIAEIEKDSWKFRSGTAVISSERETEFYKDVFGIYAKSSAARAYVLYSKAIPISYVIGVVFGRTYYALKTSYREGFAELSPGTMLFLHVIGDLGETAVSRIELLGGDARWKHELCTSARRFGTYSLYPKTIPSFLYVAAYRHIRPLMRKIVQSWRASGSVVQGLV